jgi:hypothetical protein
MPQTRPPECTEIGVLKDTSTNTESCKCPTWKKKNTPQALRISNEVRQSEWPRKRSPRVLQKKGPLHQEEMRPLNCIGLGPRDEVWTVLDRSIQEQPVSPSQTYKKANVIKIHTY